MKGLNHIYAISASLEYPEKAIYNGIRNISAICVEILSQTADFDVSSSNLKLLPLVRSAYRALEDKSYQIIIEKENVEEHLLKPTQYSLNHEFHSNSFKKETDTSKAHTKVRISTLRTEKRVVDISRHFKKNEGKKPSEFLEKASQRRQEREEQLQRRLEEKMRNEEEKRVRDEEARKISEAHKAQIEAEKKRLEDEREAAKREAEARFHSSDFFSFQIEEEEHITPQQRALQEEERKKMEEKERKKKRKEEKKIVREKELASEKAIRSKQKKIQKKEEERKNLERQAEEEKKKVLARIEYASRHERKRVKAMKGTAEVVKPTMDNRKLFIGGFTWKDLERKKLTPEVEAKVKTERVKNFFKMLEQFGPIVKRRDQILSKQLCFVTYADVDCFEKALETLTRFEERERISKEFKQKLVEVGGKEAGWNGPSPHFYVRRVNAVTEPTKKFKPKDTKNQITNKNI